MTPGTRSQGSYARAIASALERARGAPVLLSPRDFRHVADWQERGVPLALVVEAIESAAAPAARKSKRPRRVTLAYVVPAVEEAWGVVLSGRTVAPGDRGRLPSRTSDVPARWAEAAERAGSRSALARLLRHAIAQLQSGDDEARIDAEIDDALVDASPGAVREEIESRVDRELRSFAATMAAAALAATRARAIVDGLRRALDLPRLTERTGRR